MHSLLANRAFTKPFGVRGPACRANRRVVAPVAAAEEPKAQRRPSPLQRGGTLQGDLAAGKDPSEAARKSSAFTNVMQIVDGKFRDDRWVEGRWVLDMFKGADGNINWDAVIDAEMARRKLLEQTPIPSTNEEPVLFSPDEIPWWAWVKRFHLPEAEKLNGRACMVGYFAALVVDQLSGYGLVDQQNSFLGKVLLHITVFGVLLIRSTADLDNYKNLLDEATFYDKQWSASWEGVKRPSETEKSS